MHRARKILFPFSYLYGGITKVRNLLYNKNILKSYRFDIPIICVGNLSVGGTGKSPMVEYLINSLKPGDKIATLSRGYKRSTKGFQLVHGNEKASEVGDEPLQFKTKFPEITVAVDEKRVHGIQQLLDLKEPPDVIILDDAFQHRQVSAGLNVLLTSYDNLYGRDQMLPSGNLREPKSGANRAQIIVVTKCPPDLKKEEKKKIIQDLRLTNEQELFFSKIVYSENIYNAAGPKALMSLQDKTFVLLTGIANPKPLTDFLMGEGFKFEHLKFPDHHNFLKSEIQQINRHSFILTTEKDYVRLQGSIPEEKLFYLPMKMQFLEGKERFDDLVKKYNVDCKT